MYQHGATVGGDRLTTQIWEHYLFSMDKEYLKRNIRKGEYIFAKEKVISVYYAT